MDQQVIFYSKLNSLISEKRIKKLKKSYKK